MSVHKHPSPNFDARAEGKEPSLVVVHYTGMPDAAAALYRLCDPEAKVSAHYVIGENGEILQLVDEDRRAWHAGKSFWRGERDINSVSVGIELVNPGHEFGYRAFPEAQIEAFSALCQAIMDRHGIAPEGVLGHSDVAPSRKLDPNYLFPWRSLAAEGIGMWPSEEDGQGDMKALLVKYGYDPDCSEKDLITAFQRHYVPEAFEGHPEAMKRTMARLISLARL